MKYLLTGGCGFIGSHLVERLLKEDCEIIIIVDDLSEGKLENLPKDPRIKFYKGSILNNNIGRLFHGIDVVFHLAALTRPQWSIIHPEKTCRTNVEGTVRVFNHCIKHKVKRVVFVSSASAYGFQDTFPTPETAHMNPASPYALNKIEGEMYSNLYEKLNGLQVNIVRPFNVYGSRMTAGTPYSAAVPNFIRNLTKGETPWITGDGNQTRDFVYITDVVEILYLASKCEKYREIFNAGSGKCVSINELYNVVCKVVGKYIIPNYIPRVIDPDTLADMSKTKRVLNYEPKVGLEEGIRKTWNSQLRKEYNGFKHNRALGEGNVLGQNDTIYIGE